MKTEMTQQEIRNNHERAWAEQEIAKLSAELSQTREALAEARHELRLLKQQPAATARHGYLLEVTGVTVSFAGFKALNNLSVYVDHDELHAIIGPNGAGKSTLLDTICGKTRPLSGSILYKDQDLTKLKEHEIVRIGVGRKFQTPSIYEELTVLENLEVSYPQKRTVMGSLFWEAKRGNHEQDGDRLRLDLPEGSARQQGRDPQPRTETVVGDRDAPLAGSRTASLG